MSNSNTILTIVANQNFKYDESIEFLKNHFYLDIAASKVLTTNAISFEIRDFDESKKPYMQKVFFQKKLTHVLLINLEYQEKYFYVIWTQQLLKTKLWMI